MKIPLLLLLFKLFFYEKESWRVFWAWGVSPKIWELLLRGDWKFFKEAMEELRPRFLLWSRRFLTVCLLCVRFVFWFSRRGSYWRVFSKMEIFPRIPRSIYTLLDDETSICWVSWKIESMAILMCSLLWLGISFWTAEKFIFIGR